VSSACAPVVSDEGAERTELDYLATAEQVGPVAYRDPLGAISPDGHWLAYTARDRLHVVPVDGGGARVVGGGSRSIRYVTWLPDSRHVAVRERVFDRSRQEWWLYDRMDGSRTRLWPDRTDAPDLGELDMLAWSADGTRVAGVTRGGGTSSVWVMRGDGATVERAATGPRLSFPAWTPEGRLACLAFAGGRQRAHLPCGSPEPLFDDQEAFGRFAFAPDGAELYYGSPGDEGFLDLWVRPVEGGAPRRLTRFARDAYAPSVGAGGDVVFKSQDYRTFIATVPASGGETTTLTAFQSETPTWGWDGDRIAFTFGSWRHVTDDFHYPDIAQHIGTVPSSTEIPLAEPEEIVRQSHSEDQGMHWSPNGRWIVFHTHVDSDDVWLMPADGRGAARMISEGGSETGWPRWSPDGRWIVFPSYRDKDNGGRQAHLFIIGVDQETGEVTAPQSRIDLAGLGDDIIHAEWVDAGETLIFEAAAGVGRKALWSVPRGGGAPTRFHAYASDQVHSGIGASPDGLWAAYVDRGPEGFFQIFRVAVGGGEPRQLTFDPTHKTQPSVSPDGRRVAFTVFSYRAHFWRLR